MRILIARHHSRVMILVILYSRSHDKACESLLVILFAISSHINMLVPKPLGEQYNLFFRDQCETQMIKQCNIFDIVHIIIECRE